MRVNWFRNHCRQEQPGIALLAAGLATPAEQSRAASHLAGCPACQAYYQELRGVTAAITGMNRPAAGQPPARLRERWTAEILPDAREVGRNRSRAVRTPAARDGWFSRYRPGLAWALATAACVLVAFGIGYWHGRSGATDPLLNTTLVRETLAMFPNQVRAMVQDEHGIKLVLAEHRNVPTSAPLYIRINDGQHYESFLTFSGQDIVVAGQTITVLADARGDVILAGEHFFWSDIKPARLAGHWTIQAKTLGEIAM